MPGFSQTIAHTTNTKQSESIKQTTATKAIAAQKATILAMTSEELKAAIAEQISQNLFLCENSEDSTQESEDFPDNSTEDIQELNETEDINLTDGVIARGDSPTNGSEEGIDDNAPSDNADLVKEELDDRMQYKAAEMQGHVKDMYTSLQEQAYGKRSCKNNGVALNDNSFSVLIILIYHLNEFGFLPEYIDVEDVRGLQFTQDKDLFINEITSINYQYVIDNIEEINDCISFKKKIDEVKPDIMRAFNALWSLKPAGIGSRDMMEYHITMSKNIENFPDWALSMIKHNHDLIMEKNYAELIKINHRSFAEIRNVLEELGKFPPYPSFYFRPKANFCTPEIRIFYKNTGTGKNIYKAEFINNKLLNSFFFNRSYLNECIAAEEETRQGTYKVLLKDFSQIEPSIQKDINKISNVDLKDLARDAMSFMGFLSQRQLMLKEIAEYIIENEKEYFESGSNLDFKPLKQKDLDTRLNCNSSQVSRLVNNKYIEVITPNGTVIKPISFFFKEPDYVPIIDAIIKSEDPHNPYNDGELRKLLIEQSGITISQPTIVRIRKELGYPNSEGRKIKD